VIYGNHECFDHDRTDDERDEFQPDEPTPDEVRAMNEAGWTMPGLSDPLPTPAEVAAMLADAPAGPPPTDAELDAMDAYYNRYWNWAAPF
jgi:hypothetical protein